MNKKADNITFAIRSGKVITPRRCGKDGHLHKIAIRLACWGITCKKTGICTILLCILRDITPTRGLATICTLYSFIVLPNLMTNAIIISQSGVK